MHKYQVLTKLEDLLLHCECPHLVIEQISKYICHFHTFTTVHGIKKHTANIHKEVLQVKHNSKEMY